MSTEAPHVFIDPTGVLLYQGGSPERWKAEAIEPMAAALGKDPAAFERAFSQSGQARLLGGWKSMTQGLGVYGPPEGANAAAAKYEAYVRRYWGPIPGALEDLRWLRGAGVQVGAITLCGPSYPALLAEAGFLELLAPACFSCQTRLNPFEPEAFLHAAREAGTKPERCLFLAADLVAAEAATAAGFQTRFIAVRRDAGSRPEFEMGTQDLSEDQLLVGLRDLARQRWFPRG